MSNLIREPTVDGVVARGCVAVSDDEPEESKWLPLPVPSIAKRCKTPARELM